jgi:hypothetical protein
MFVSLQIVDPQECIDCVQKAVDKDYSSFIACTITIVVGAVIRAIEKRKIKRKMRR